MERLFPLVGIALLLGIAVLCSTNRRAIRIRAVAWGLGLQFVLACFVLKTAPGRDLFALLGTKIKELLEFSYAGSQVVFGALGVPGGVSGVPSLERIFAFQVLPTIIFIAALFAVLYHLGVMQIVVRFFAFFMSRLMGTSGAESLNVAASIFMGQTEAPLTIRPFLEKLTLSELMCVMTSGMAHISGGIMAAYVSWGIDPRHLLAAGLMTAPGTILMAKIFVPETEEPETMGRVRLDIPKLDANVVGAAARGSSEGLSLALNVGAMLISFLALVALVNAILGHFSPALTLQNILGVAFAPIARTLGVASSDAATVGGLLGTRLVTNEFIAYQQLSALHGVLDPRSYVIATYALCGFANVGSIGIQIGGIGALVPSRRNDLARLAVRALCAGTFANFITACIAGMLL